MVLYDVSDLPQVQGSSTIGTQRKWYSHIKNVYIKEQAKINGLFVQDNKIEVLASAIERQIFSTQDYVQYYLCTINDGIANTSGCVSNNFLQADEYYISLYKLMNKFDIGWESSWSIEQKYLAILNAYTYAGVRAEQYLSNNFAIDYIMWNSDRHLRNLGIIYSTKTKSYKLPPIFDNGRGLFIGSNDVLDKPGLKGCNVIKCLPYGNNYDTVFQFFKDQGYLKFLRETHVTLVYEDFPNIKAYFLSIRNLTKLGVIVDNVPQEYLTKVSKMYL